MSKNTTRLRVARIAAAGVFAAGASLTVAGMAQAAGTSGSTQAGVNVSVQLGQDETPPPTDTPTPLPTETPTTPVPTETPTTPVPTETPTTPVPTGTPTTPVPTQSTPGHPTPSSTSTSPSQAPSAGGSDNGGGNTCTLNGDSVNCENNTGTDNQNTQPVAQGNTDQQLAETGAGETTLLLVGAATMIAGGIGFRFMPRMVNRRTAA